jgi:hypothetical protein
LIDFRSGCSDRRSGNKGTREQGNKGTRGTREQGNQENKGTREQGQVNKRTREQEKKGIREQINKRTREQEISYQEKAGNIGGTTRLQIVAESVNPTHWVTP